MSMDKDNAAPSEKFLSGFGTAPGGSPAYRCYARGAQKCYKPTTTRLPFLAGVLILTLALVAIVEIVLRQYPVDGDLGSLAAPNTTRRWVDMTEDWSVGINQGNDIGARGQSTSDAQPSEVTSISVSSTGSINTSTQSSVDSSSARSSTDDSTGTTINGAYLPTPSFYQTSSSAYMPTTPIVQILSSDGLFLSLTSPLHKTFYRTQPLGYAPTSVVPPQTAPSGYNQPTSTSIPIAYDPTTQVSSVETTITLPSDPSVSTTLTTTPEADNPTITPSQEASSVASPKNGLESLSTAPWTAIPSNPNGVGASRSPNGPTSTVVELNAASTSLVPVATQTSGGMAVVILGSPSQISLSPVSTYTSNGIAPVMLGSPTQTSLVPVSTYISNGAAYVIMGTSSKTSLVPISTLTSNGAAVVVLGTPTSQATGAADLSSSYSVTVEQVTSTSGSVAYVYMTTLTLSPTSHTTTTAEPQNTATTTPEQQKTNIVFTNMSYFAAWYLPTMVAVAFRVIWTIVYNNARLMEPFYRLASPSGVTGKDALDNLYLSIGSIVPEPILALLSGHSYMLLVSSIAYLIELIAPLSSEFLIVDVHHGCNPDPGADVNHPCNSRIVVRLVPARVLQGILCLIAILIIFTMFLSRHRPSGVYSDPSSIAVMASLLHHPDVLQDFKHLDASNKELERTVKDQTYRLKSYQSEDEGIKYGIVPTVKIIMPDTSSRGTYNLVANLESGADISSHDHGLFTRHLFRTIGDIALAILLLGLFGVTLGYYLDSHDDGFNRFFDSDTFGPRFILSFAGGIAVSQWKRLEKEVRTLQPYRYLSSSHSSSPSTTILHTSPSTPYSTLTFAIIHVQPFTALVALCYILSEILVITLITVPYNPGEYYRAFLAGAYISLSILGLQFLTFVGMLSWWRWTTPHLDRDPDTLIGVWALLAASSVREDFEDLGTAGRKELVSTVLAWEKRYELVELMGKDGVMRVGICGETADGGFARERPASPLPFSLPTLPPVPRIIVSPDI